ncbi:MAG: class I SAM-dependent methyltransferase [Alkalimonas sp.]|nr:class I SAM-dependent methyltransferase [Alkalimonas sp.]
MYNNSQLPADLPYSQACENNKKPILSVIKPAFARCKRVLEVGSGTGQHAVYFASELPHLLWQCSDQPAYLPDLQRRLQHQAASNLPAALPLDIRQSDWSEPAADGVFSANTLHIMAWPVVQRFFQRLDSLAARQAELCIYGPFNYQGEFTSQSNHQFHLSLQQRDPAMGIRDQEAIVELASAIGFQLQADHSMPANNRLLHFSR